MVEIGENLYIVGGVSSYGSDQKEMHQLSCVSGSCSWTTLIQQLTVARFGLVAIPVDDIFCHSPCQKGDFNPTIFWPYFAIIAFIFMLNLSKWRILSQPAKIGSGKNKNSLFFLLVLKITLRTCFESNNFSSNFCPGNQVLSFLEGQIY